MSDKEQVRGKSVLLFSGGMDSLILNHLLTPDVLLWIPTTESYYLEESVALNTLVRLRYVSKEKLVRLPGVLDLDNWEREGDFVVPNRNAYLVLLAANYGEDIYLGAAAGDWPYDKDKEFCYRMGELLNHMNKEQAWTEARHFRVRSPYYTNFHNGKSKTEMVKMYLEHGGSKDALLISYSCYSGKSTPCGVCKPCFRKWVALINNNIKFPDGYFATDPKEAPWLPEVLPLIAQGKWHPKEDESILKALEACS